MDVAAADIDESLTNGTMKLIAVIRDPTKTGIGLALSRGNSPLAPVETKISSRN